MLTEPELFFEEHRDNLVYLVEIQHIPEIFSVLRSEVDRNRRLGKFLILGSALQDLIHQSSESLAGRIAPLDLTPFLFPEVESNTKTNEFWLRGRFPDNLLAAGDEDSFDWREDFIGTLLESTKPGGGFNSLSS